MYFRYLHWLILSLPLLPPCPHLSSLFQKNTILNLFLSALNLLFNVLDLPLKLVNGIVLFLVATESVLEPRKAYSLKEAHDKNHDVAKGCVEEGGVFSLMVDSGEEHVVG